MGKGGGGGKGGLARRSVGSLSEGRLGLGIGLGGGCGLGLRVGVRVRVGALRGRFFGEHGSHLFLEPVFRVRSTQGLDQVESQDESSQV